MASYCVYLAAVLCIVQGLNALPSSENFLERSKREVEYASQEIEIALQGVDLAPQGLIAEAIKNAVEDGKDKVQDALERLQTRLDEAMTTVQQNYVRLQSKGDEALVETTATLAQITDGYNLKLETALGNATTQAQKTCIEVAKTEGLAVIGNLAKNLVSCVTDKIEEARNIVVDVITQAKRTIALVQTVPDRFSSCSQGAGKTLADIVKVTVCIGKQVLVIQSEAFGITVALAKNVILVQKIATTIQTDMASCALHQLMQIQLDIAKAVKDVTNCVSNNIANKIS